MADLERASRKFFDFLDARIRLIQNDWDFNLAWTGARRGGKSGGGHWTGLYLDTQQGYEYDPVKQVAFSIQQFKENCAGLQRGRSSKWDELTKGGLARGHAGKSNRDMEEYYTVSGFYGVFGQLMIPNLGRADRYLREDLVQYEAHVQARYPDHTVNVLRQRSEGEKLFHRPKDLFEFLLPKPFGPEWERERELKAQFGAHVVAGVDHDEQHEKTQFFESIRMELGPGLGVLGFD